MGIPPRDPTGDGNRFLRLRKHAPPFPRPSTIHHMMGASLRVERCLLFVWQIMRRCLHKPTPLAPSPRLLPGDETPSPPSPRRVSAPTACVPAPPPSLSLPGKK